MAHRPPGETGLQAEGPHNVLREEEHPDLGRRGASETGSEPPHGARLQGSITLLLSRPATAVPRTLAGYCGEGEGVGGGGRGRRDVLKGAENRAPES